MRRDAGDGRPARLVRRRQIPQLLREVQREKPSEDSEFQKAKIGSITLGAENHKIRFRHSVLKLHNDVGELFGSLKEKNLLREHDPSRKGLPR